MWVVAPTLVKDTWCVYCIDHEKKAVFVLDHSIDPSDSHLETYKHSVLAGIIKEAILTCLYLSENYDAGDPAAWGTFVLSPVTCLQQGLVIVHRYTTVSIPACRFLDST